MHRYNNFVKFIYFQVFSFNYYIYIIFLDYLSGNSCLTFNKYENLNIKNIKCL